MSTRILLRRDTTVRWASVNPVLAAGEPAVESDTGKLKVGDGTSAWSALPYILDVSDLTPVIQDLLADLIPASYTDEQVRDVIGASIVGDGDFINVTVSDASNSIRVEPGAALTEGLDDLALGLAAKQDAATLAADAAAHVADGSELDVALRVTFGAKANRLHIADIPEPWVSPHRGAGIYVAPENTLEAMDLGIALGFQLIDGGDWWLGADGTLICIHDATVDRTTTATGNTVDLTAATRDALVVDAGSWFGGGWGNLKVPTWAQVMARAERAVIGVEPKHSAAAPVMAADIAARGLQASVFPNSFSVADLQHFAQVGCSVAYSATGALTGPQITQLQALKTAGAPEVYVSVFPGFGSANIAAARAAGFKVVTSGIQRHHQLAEFTGTGVVGHFSDDPAYVRQSVESSASLGLLARQHESGLLRRRRDPFDLQTYYHGMQSYTNDLTNRGTFAGGNRWQAPFPHRWALHGWLAPLPDEWTVDLTVRFDALGSVSSRWAGIWLGTSDRRYSAANFSDENGVQVWFRTTGSLEAATKTDGAQIGATQVAATAAVAALGTAKIRLQKTATQLIASRTDVPGTVTISEARVLPYLFLGQNGDNGGADSGLRTSFFNVERVA